jgi:hypothetical protein
VTTPNIRDLESLFYGGGEDAKYEALQAFAEEGWDATTLLTILETSQGPEGPTGPTGPVGPPGTPIAGVAERAAVGVGEEPTTADYQLVTGDLGKLLLVETETELPIVVIVPEGLGTLAHRIELASTDGLSVDVAGTVALVIPDDKVAETRAPFSVVQLTRVDDDVWLVSGDLADAP